MKSIDMTPNTKSLFSMYIEILRHAETLDKFEFVSDELAKHAETLSQWEQYGPTLCKVFIQALSVIPADYISDFININEDQAEVLKETKKFAKQYLNEIKK